MDVREKLVELLNEVQETGVNEIPAGFGCTLEYIANEKVASHLTDNGVTVQEWISVTEMLPEDDSDVLAYSSIEEESRIYPACYSNGVWFDCVFNAPATDTTTHWMPIPQPPKGE